MFSVILQRVKAFRSSRSQMFFKKGAPKNFAIFTEKHLRWILFLIKFQAFKPTTLIKIDSGTGVFLWILRNFFRTSSFILWNLSDGCFWTLKESEVTFCMFQKQSPRGVLKKGVIRNFTKFTGTHLSKSLRPATLLKKRLWHRCFPVSFVKACNFIKKRLWHRCFPVNLVKFLRTPFLAERLRWLLLMFYCTRGNRSSKCYSCYILFFTSSFS